MQQIAYSGQLSSVQSVLFGVLQGSVLGPLLYVLFAAELALVVDRHGLNLHQYADNTQVYISTPAGDAEAAVRRFVSLSGMAPPYLAADCQLVSDEGRRQLRSAYSRTCVVRRTCSSYGDRCFASAGLTLWNSLPAHLRQTDINFEQFKRQLKTFLFGR